MNKIFHIVWNASLGQSVVASELAKSKSQPRTINLSTPISAGIPLTVIVTAIATMLFSSPVFASTPVGGGTVANPNGGQIAISGGTGCSAPATASGTTTTGGIAVGCDSVSNGVNSIAIGVSADAIGTATTAVGVSANASAASATALGNTARATASSATALGSGSTASNVSAIGIGNGAVASGSNATSIGSQSDATGINSIAFGSVAQATTDRAIAIGHLANAGGLDSIYLGSRSAAGTGALGQGTIAIGTDVTASGLYSMAVGFNAVSSGDRGTAVGYNATASGLEGTALGLGTAATATNAVAVGNQVRAEGTGSIAIAGNSGVIIAVDDASTNGIAIGNAATVVNASSAIALGTRAAVSGANAVAAGTDTTATASGAAAYGWEASATGVNSTALGRLAAAGAQNAVAIGGAAGATDANAIAVGFTSRAIAADTVAIGTGAVADAAEAVAIGNGSTATGGKAVAIGSQNVASGNGAVAIGDPNTATGDGAVAQGMDNTATGNGSVAMGNTNMVGGGGQAVSTPGTAAQGAVGIGYQNIVVGQGSVAIGNTSQALAAGSLAFGDTAVANNAGDVALGSGSVTAAAVPTTSTTIRGTTYNFAGDAPTSVVSVGAPNAERQIQNVAAGRISSTSTDAVNGSQLFAVQDSLQSAVAGAAPHYYSVNDDGTISGNYNNDGATGVNALAAGVDAAAGGLQSLAVGFGANATGASAAAVGQNTQATEQNALAIGTGANAAGTNSTALGVSSSTSGQGSQAIGSFNTATGFQAVAMGRESTATGDASLAVGNSATATGNDTMAIGHSAIADGLNGTMAVGLDASATGASATAIGSSATASNTGDVALGSGSVTAAAVPTTNTTIRGTTYNFAGDAPTSVVSVGAPTAERQIQNVAAGRVSSTSTDAINGSQLFAVQDSLESAVAGAAPHYLSINDGGTISGNYNNDGASAVGATALGVAAQASAASSTAIGNNANAGDMYAIAAGLDSNASGLASVAIGLGAIASEVNAVYLGSRSLAGTGAIGRGSVAIGNEVTASALSSIGIGSTATSTGIASIAVGRSAAASADNAISVGIRANANSINALALGTEAAASASNALAIGTQSQALGERSIALGYDAIATGSVAMGASSRAGNGGAAFGDGAIATYNGGVNDPAIVAGAALGENALADVSGATALGTGASAGQANAVALGSGSVTAAAVATPGATIGGTAYTFAGTGPTSTVSVGDVGAERTITNVAAGRISGTSTDAVNGSQLFATNQQVDQNTTNITNLDGRVTTIEGDITDINNGAGIKYFHANSALADSQALGTNSVAIGPEAVANNAGDVALGNGSVTDVAVATTGTTIDGTNYTFAGTAPTSTVSVGAAGAERTVTNVAAGRIDATSTDAINGSQLFATNQAVEEISDVANAGWNLTAQGADETNVAPGDSVDLANTDGNLSIAKNAVDGAAESVTFDLSDDVTIGNSLTVNNGPTINESGIDMNGDTITNIGAPVNEGDAVNLSYFNQNRAHYYSVNDGGTQGGNYDNDGATGVNSLAAGVSATASSDESVALGYGSSSSVNGGVALGAGAVADRTTVPSEGIIEAGTAQITYNTTDQTLLGAVSVGSDDSYRQITNVADGTSAQDAVTIRQLQGAISSVTSTGTKYFHANSADGTDADDLSDDSLAVGVGSVGIGPYTIVNGDNGIGIGNDALVESTAPGGTAIGQSSHVSAADAIAIGTESEAFGEQSIAIGAGATASEASSVALGGNSATAPVVATEGITLNGTNYSFAGTEPVGTVSIGDEGSERTITNVAAGRINADSTDAINGSQLYTTNQVLEELGDSFDNVAGNTDEAYTEENGVGIRYVRTNETGLDASDAFAQTPGSTAVGYGATATGADALALGRNATASEDGSVALGAGATTASTVATEGITIAGQDYAFAGSDPIGTVSIGSPGYERTLTNVAAGRISASSTDAINGSQLYATNQAVDNIDDRVTQNEGNIDNLDNRVTNVEGDIENLGDQVTQLGDQSVKYGTNPDGSINYGNITLEGDEGTTITNVAAGDISEGSSDAVNGSQLWEVENKITNITQGGTKYFKANSEAADAKASGAESVAMGPKSVAKGDHSVAAGDGAVASSEGGVALGAGSQATREGMNGGEEAFSKETVASTQGAVSVGSEGGERQITHVAGGTEDTDAVNVRQLSAVQAGAVNYDRNDDGSIDYSNVTLGQEGSPTQIHNVAPGTSDTDAVNVGQMNELNQRFQQQLGGLHKKIEDVEDQANAGTASALAAASVPQAYLPGKSMVAAGAGTYQGESAVAVGVSRLSDNGRWAIKLNATGDTQNNFGAGVGVGFHW